MLRITMPRIGYLFLAGALALLPLPACSTPLPDPPDLDPPRPEDLTATPNDGIVAGTVDLRGAAGAAEPSARLRVFSLDDLGPPVDALVAADGSFAVSVPASRGGELRLSLSTDEARSPPLDLVVPEVPGPPTLAVRASCVTLAPTLELALEEGVGTLLLTNGCGAPIDVEHALRAPVEGLTIEGPTEPVGDAETAVLTVTLEPARAVEEVLLLSLTGAVTDRRPVTIH